MNRETPRLTEARPGFATRLEQALREQGEEDLAVQVPTLRLVRACVCGDEYCRSFWTGTPIKRWFRRGRNVVVEGLDEGLVALDAIDGRIVYVEVVVCSR